MIWNGLKNQLFGKSDNIFKHNQVVFNSHIVYSNQVVYSNEIVYLWQQQQNKHVLTLARGMNNSYELLKFSTTTKQT